MGIVPMKELNLQHIVFEKLLNMRLTSVLFLFTLTIMSYVACKHDEGEMPKPKIVEWADPPSNPRQSGQFYFENDILKLMVTKCAIERLDNYELDDDDSNNETYSGCHSSSDAQHGVVLDNHAGIKALADDEEWVKTEFYDHIIDKDDMPPSAISAQLNSDELTMLQWWVENNTPDNSCDPCEEVKDSSYLDVRRILYRNCSGCHNDGLAKNNSGIASFFKALPENETYADSMAIVNNVGQILNYMEKYDNPMPKHIGRLYKCEVDAIRNWSKRL